MNHVQEKALNFLLIFLAIIHNVISTSYYITPDDDSEQKGMNYHSLQHYLINTSEYFISHNQFHFMPGQYYISDDLILKDIKNVSLIGNDQCVITCTSPASVLIINVTSFVFHNIKLINCTKSHKEYFNDDVVNLLYTRDNGPFITVTEYQASVFLLNSSSVAISDIDIIATVMKSFTAILILNLQDVSKLISAKVQINSFNCTADKYPVQINGITVYHSDGKTIQGKLIIENFQYNNTYGLCANHFHCVITLLFLERIKKFTSILKIYIQNSAFNSLKNSSILCYYEKTRHDKLYHVRHRLVKIHNVTICNNSGHSQLNMFYIVYKSVSRYTNLWVIGKTEAKRVYNEIKFYNCVIANNVDMNAAVYVNPSTANTIIGLLTFFNSTFQKNKKVKFITVKEHQTLWYKATHFRIFYANISNNEHSDCDSLIFVNNGIITLRYAHFNQNRYFRNVISLQSSMLLFQNYTEITNNYARHIVKAQSKSFLFIDISGIVNISYNVVYKTIKLVSTLEKYAVPICPLQGHRIMNSKNLQLKNISCKLLLLHNTEMISKSLPTEINSYINNKNCTWLQGSIFQNMNVNVNTVYKKIIKYDSNTYVNKNNIKRLIPLSICPCLSNTSYNCSVTHLYSTFPGQVLQIYFIVSLLWSDLYSTTVTLVATNTIEDDCSIVDGSQLSQTHHNNGCNRYSYTIWPNSESLTECKLFVGLSEMPEMFYIQMKPCPMGFTLNTNMKACHCDVLLSNNILSISSCDINDATILRPANSWISAETVNGSHSYNISPQCPFDYCLPHSSHLNLSDPDSQCQFNRTGVLCGECKQGLSVSIMFGSSQCKHCSNFYVFMIIPIAIAGIMLVIMLFIFNLTVTNGIINTLIFYVNIISINYSQFCFENYTPDCVILSLFNLDFGYAVCFYDGMDGYVKTWLQLAFPSYLTIIAFALIIGSRYSSKLQRLTANRVLKVLATLFLLSYTKILSTVCQVLFFFSIVTHLPNKHNSIVWSVDTGVAVFGMKFCILYSVCLIFFILLLLFNAVLLFPRTVSRWRFVNSFKPLLDAYFGPYKSQYPYWTGLQLLIRSCFFGLSALRRNISLPGGVLLVAIVLCTHGILHPFKSKFKNIQESLVSLNLLVLHVIIALYPDSINNFYKLLIIRALISTILVYFTLLIFYHCAILLCGDLIKKKANKIKQTIRKMISVKQERSKPLHMKELRSQIPDVAFNYKEYQEPLVALD